MVSFYFIAYFSPNVVVIDNHFFFASLQNEIYFILLLFIHHPFMLISQWQSEWEPMNGEPVTAVARQIDGQAIWSRQTKANLLYHKSFNTQFMILVTCHHNNLLFFLKIINKIIVLICVCFRFIVDDWCSHFWFLHFLMFSTLLQIENYLKRFLS